jgi:hypothetical protein
MKNLEANDYAKIEESLNQQIEMNDINTSSWIPGNDWTNTVYQPIYHACGSNKEASGLFFGLILFNILMQRTDGVWGFGRFEKDGVLIRGTTYFIINNPPQR